MKRISALLLSLIMIFSLASCGSNETSEQNETIGVTAENSEVTVGEIGQQTDAADTAIQEKEPEKKYPDNILIDPYGSGGNVLFNTAVSKDSIKTVTFLDTLADMPADAWDVSEAKNGSVMAWVIDGSDLFIAGEGGVTARSCNQLFKNYQKLTSIDFGGCFYTDLTDRITEMFVYCYGLTTLDLSGWNTSNIKYMSDAFHDCQNLKSINLSGWDTSNVTTMTCMFEGCKNLETVDISHFNTSNVASFISMFDGCKKLTTIDTSKWDTSAAKSMEDMFHGCNSLVSIGDLKIPEGCITDDMYLYSPLG